jgi:benzoyl-CoA reductase/2-hydroxyglutaryl-CoA dehydratase subunit BcrC/BadD/HgdB
VNPELANLVKRAQELSDDFSLEAVRRWKQVEAGRKAIGHMPIYVPRELIHAAGMLPVGIVGAGDRLEIIRGDAYFQSYICHIPRSTIELALSRRLDVLDGMLFPSICDVIRNLSGMWSMLFPQRYVRYVDVPQNFDPKVGGPYWSRELEKLRDDFSQLSGRPIEDADLCNSIVVYNENRSTIRELYRARRDRSRSCVRTAAIRHLRAAIVRATCCSASDSVRRGITTPIRTSSVGDRGSELPWHKRWCALPRCSLRTNQPARSTRSPVQKSCNFSGNWRTTQKLRFCSSAMTRMLCSVSPQEPS